MAEFHAAPRGRKRRRERGPLARHDTDRGSLQARRLPSWPRLPSRAAGQGRVEVLHKLGLLEVHPPRPIGERGVRRVLKALFKAGGLAMTTKTERAVLAGGCFWGMQQLVRHFPGVVSTRVGYSGGDVKNATYRNHGTHAEAIEIIFDPNKTTFRSSSSFRSTTRRRAIVRATTMAASRPTRSASGSRSLAATAWRSRSIGWTRRRCSFVRGARIGWCTCTSLNRACGAATASKPAMLVSRGGWTCVG